MKEYYKLSMKGFGWALFWLAPIILLLTWVLWVFTMLFLYNYPPPVAQYIYWLVGFVAIPIFAPIAMTGGWLLAHHSGGRRTRLSTGFVMVFASVAIFIFIMFIDYMRDMHILPFAPSLLYFILVLVGGLCLIVPGSLKKSSHIDAQPPDEPVEEETPVDKPRI